LGQASIVSLRANNRREQVQQCGLQTALFDHLVGAIEQRLRRGYAKRLDATQQGLFSIISFASICQPAGLAVLPS